MSREDQLRELIATVQSALEDRENFRFGLEPRHLKALIVVLTLALALSLSFFVLAKPKVEEVVAPAMPAKVNEQIVVDVAGKVAKPGVYHFDQGARAIDALQAAGGALPGVSTANINLAHILTDGEQILVGADEGQASSLININTADVNQLDQLPGVGPVLAGRIVSWRQTHGRFRSVDQIKEVPGVGAATFADLKNLIRI